MREGMGKEEADVEEHVVLRDALDDANEGRLEILAFALRAVLRLLDELLEA